MAKKVFLCVFVVYPPLAEMTDEDKAVSWKPGQRKKKSEKVDSTWNPKSKSRELSSVRLPPAFPACGASCKRLLCVMIGSFNCLRLLTLANKSSSFSDGHGFYLKLAV